MFLYFSCHRIQGTALVGAGIILNFQSIQVYVVDTFSLYAASGMFRPFEDCCFLLTHSCLQLLQQSLSSAPSQDSHSLSSLRRCIKYWDLGKAIPFWRLWLSSLGVQREYHFVSGIDIRLSRPLGRFCFGRTASEYGRRAGTLASLLSKLRRQSPGALPDTY